MDYISTRETAEKWGVSLRYVQKLIEDNRIPGAKKFGVSWLLPTDAVKPDDLRRVRKKSAERKPPWLLLPPTVLAKRNPNVTGTYSSCGST